MTPQIKKALREYYVMNADKKQSFWSADKKRSWRVTLADPIVERFSSEESQDEQVGVAQDELAREFLRQFEDPEFLSRMEAEFDNHSGSAGHQSNDNRDAYCHKCSFPTFGKK